MDGDPKAKKHFLFMATIELEDESVEMATNRILNTLHRALKCGQKEEIGFGVTQISINLVQLPSER